MKGINNGNGTIIANSIKILPTITIAFNYFFKW